VAAALAGAGQQEQAEAVAGQAEAVARSITSPGDQGRALAQVAAALAGAGLYQQAEAVARSITSLYEQGWALAQVAAALAGAGQTRAANQVAAAACAIGEWTAAAPAVLLLNPAAFLVLARVLDLK
jgi:hypothetical protein